MRDEAGQFAFGMGFGGDRHIGAAIQDGIDEIG